MYVAASPPSSLQPQAGPHIDIPRRRRVKVYGLCTAVYGLH